MEQILVRDLDIEACHGCGLGERETPQSFRVQVTVDLFPRESTEDTIENTLNYLDVIEICRDVMTGPPRHLLETLSGEIADRILALGGAAGIEIEIEKRQPPIPGFSGHVGVRLFREAL